MLEFLRQKAQSTVIQVIIVAIILVFVFWGVGGQQGSGVNAVATVNDEPIPYSEYQRTYDERFSQLRDQLGGSIPDGLLQSFGLKEQVLEGLIQRTLIRQAAQRIGLTVSDSEVRDAIRDMEAFRSEGRFDAEWYRQILAGSRMSVADFEKSMKDDLLVTKVTDHLARFGGAPDSELRDRFEYNYKRRQFSYVAFKPADFADKVEIDAGALAEFFEKQQEQYRGEPQLKLKYVRFPFDERSEVEIPDVSITSYFQENRDDYVVPEQRRARHILIMSDEGDSQEEISVKRQKAEELLERAREGADFAELAREESDDLGSASRGGDLGFFGRGQMVKPFEDAVFRLEEGGLTMARSDFGYHVIKVEEIKPPRVKSLDEVRDEIIAEIKDAEIKNLAFTRANAAYEQIILSGSLANYAASGGQIEETEFFSRQKTVEPFKSNPVFLESAFSLKEGELSSLLEGSDSYAIFYVEEIREPAVPALSEVEERVKKDFVEQRSRQLAREAAEEVLAAVKESASLQDQAARLGLKAEESPLISRAEAEDIALPSPLVEAGLGLSAAAPYPETVVASGEILYVAGFQAEEQASEEEFAAKEEEIRRELLSENEDDILSAWLTLLRERAEVEIDKNF
ncbi:MAG: SurA N-terminal domain-containing protein [Desulfurivibrionaceae bacterium]